ncbi:MAG TPA: hypothetical protein PLS23_21965, partial [Phycisphaerae bacterium]|nr:hypothetical protein [Phycisphaerae bacterium]
LAEKSLPFELEVDIPWLADTRVPSYNPLGKVPALVADDGEQREEFEDALDKYRNKDGELVRKGIYRAMLAVFVVCDENGKLIFSESDAVALSRKAVKPLMRIQAKANQLNSLTAADVEAIEKNCASTPESDSGCN